MPIDVTATVPIRHQLATDLCRLLGKRWTSTYRRRRTGRTAAFWYGDVGIIGAAAVVAAGSDLHRVALRVGDPGCAKRGEEVMRRAQHANAVRAQFCERRIHIVGPHHDLGPWRAGAGGHAMHLAQGLDRGQPQGEPVKAQLNMGRRALLRRAKCLGEPKQAAVEIGSGLDVLDVEVDLRGAEHQAIMTSAAVCHRWERRGATAARQGIGDWRLRRTQRSMAG